MGTRWHTHCKEFYAKAKAEGKKLSWRDVLVQASNTYQKNPKPPKPEITWVQHVKAHAAQNKQSYKQALQDPKCQGAWKALKDSLVKPTMSEHVPQPSVFQRPLTKEQQAVADSVRAEVRSHQDPEAFLKWANRVLATEVYKPKSHNLSPPPAKVVIPSFVDVYNKRHDVDTKKAELPAD